MLLTQLHTTLIRFHHFLCGSLELSSSDLLSSPHHSLNHRDSDGDLILFFQGVVVTLSLVEFNLKQHSRGSSRVVLNTAAMFSGQMCGLWAFLIVFRLNLELT